MAFIVSTAVLMAASYIKWNEIIEDVYQELAGVRHILLRSASDIFYQQESMFKVLGERLKDVGGLNNVEQSREIMDDLLRDNPVFTAYGLASVDGKLLITSLNIRNQSLPNLQQMPRSASTFKEALEIDGLSIGRTYYFELLGRWIMPLRYAVRDESGEVVFVITTGINLEGPYNPWSTERIKDEIDINVTRTIDDKGDYYLLYAAPHTSFLNVTRSAVYDNPLPTRFVEDVIDRLENITGEKLQNLIRSDFNIRFKNDIPGIDPAYVDISYDSRRRYFLSVRQNQSSIESVFYLSLSSYIVGYFIFNLLFFSALFHMFKSDERYKDSLRYEALHDSLTDLPNRYSLKEGNNDWVKQNNYTYSLMYLDLDNFKFVNDHFGHSVGDIVLVEMSKRLSQICGKEKLLIRHGGDEFLILTSILEQQKLLPFIEQLIHRIKEPIFIKDIRVSLTASIGIAFATEADQKYEDLLVKADLAMYQAKRVRNSYAFFSQDMQEKNDEIAVLESALHSALQLNEMYLMYQPQIDAKTGAIVGVEALIRWQSSKLGLVPPDKFINIAEVCGQINSIGDFVIDSAFREISPFQQSSKPIRLSINVSVQQLIHGGFRDYLKRKLAENNLNSRDIILEVTESLFIEDFRHIGNLLKQLENDGFGISLDDFGTGYSSLGVLRNLPVSEVKIDKSFVRDIMIDKQDKALIKGIISIGQSLEIPTLAEGVEELEQAQMLKRYGCDLFQGYYFGRPMKVADLKTFMESFEPQKI